MNSPAYAKPTPPADPVMTTPPFDMDKAVDARRALVRDTPTLTGENACAVKSSDARDANRKDLMV
jgi:hypothetical protein